MTIALIADVHGNLPALEAVLHDARRQGATAVWNLGDSVGYGPFPQQCVDLLCRAAEINLLGNYDAKVLKFPRKKHKWRRSKSAAKFLFFRFAYENLTPKMRRRLGRFPAQHRVQLAGRRCLLVHGSPAGIADGLTTETPPERFERFASLAEADVIACGHTHRPLAHRAAGPQGDVWFFNPGSVGRPEDGDPRSSYALFGLGGTGPTWQVRRVAYDVERVVRAVAAAGLPGELGEMFRRGVRLDRATPLAPTCGQALPKAP